MRLNIKNFGFDIARALGTSQMSDVPAEPPRIVLDWRASTQADIESDWMAYWCDQVGVRPLYHRKLWEIAYVLHNLWLYGMMEPGKRGLGFGCGTEVTPSYMAKHGVQIVATDLPPDHAEVSAWIETAQYAEDKERLWHPSLVEKEAFDRCVSLEFVDMNILPAHLIGFDFCWSICAFEHVGSIEKGIEFLLNSMDTLRPGGVAIHTTEFNFRDGPNLDNWGTVLFQKQHFEEMALRLRAAGHTVGHISYDIGNKPLDRFIDIPPYLDLPTSMDKISEYPAHLKLGVGGLTSTCFGLVITKRDG